MASLPSAQSAVATVQASMTVSPLEELLLGTEKPASMLIHIYHSFFHPTVPADHLLAVLPNSSLLILRAVSRTTKAWVEEMEPGVLTKLRVPCPLPRFALQVNSTFRRLSHGCRHLTVKLLPSPTPIPIGSLLNPSPTGQILNIVHNFSSLRIVLPPADAFEPVLSLCLALELTPLKSLVAIHIEPVDLKSLLAFRWGGFNAFSESTWIGQTFWRGLKSLRIGMTTEWLGYAHKDLESEKDSELKTQLKEEIRLYRQGMQALHDYFFNFSLQDTLETLRFDWVDCDGCGPNPLLLDEEVTKEEGGKWFSAPGLIWKGLKEVWLGRVALSGTDLKTLKERMEGMEKLMVLEPFAAKGIRGKIMKIEGLFWLDVDLKAEIPEPMEDEDAEDLLDTVDENERDRGESMVVPFVLQI
ncbi:MAG: hypothetical protein LQ343_004648 [Gyalolechia ehrenbergii]|nr:MAG: hypothetical protein LQ343_004648 [Gyalolechia ehrenbergii]